MDMAELIRYVEGGTGEIELVICLIALSLIHIISTEQFL